jgi:hypothetical protein
MGWAISRARHSGCRRHPSRSLSSRTTRLVDEDPLLSRPQMYRVRRWNNDRDEMTEEFVDVFVLGHRGVRFVSVTWVPSVSRRNQDEIIPVLAAGPGGIWTTWPPIPAPLAITIGRIVIRSRRRATGQLAPNTPPHRRRGSRRKRRVWLRSPRRPPDAGPIDKARAVRRSAGS